MSNMLKCNIVPCIQSFRFNESYLNHLKLIHGYGTTNIYNCPHNCPLTSKNLKVFKRHLLNAHSDFNKPSIAMTEPLSINSNNNNNTSESPGISPIVEAFATENERIFDSSSQSAEYDIKAFKQRLDSDLKSFLSYMYSENNLAKAQCQEIFNQVTVKFAHPMLHFLENHFKCTDMNIKILCKEIKKSFSDLKSETKFVSAMKKDEIFCSPEKFLIEIPKIGPAMKDGVPVLATTTKEGTLMPIKFQIQRFFETPNVLKDTLKYIEESER